MKNHLTRPMRGKLAWVKTWSIGSLDAEPFSLRLERERSIEDGTGHEERGEQVRQNADAQGDGEAADRAGPVPVQEDTAISVVQWLSMMVLKALSKPAAMAAFTVRP